MLKNDLTIIDVEVKNTIVNFYGLEGFTVDIRSHNNFYYIFIFKSVFKTDEIKKLLLDSSGFTFEKDTGEFIISVNFKKIFKNIEK